MNTQHLPQRLILRKNEERRVHAGHPWVFSNEIRETSGDPRIGDVVEVFTAGGLSLGIAFYNPHSLIAARMISKNVEEIQEDFFRDRILAALSLRKMLYPEQNSYRLVYGESDFLPGLIIDRFEGTLVVQTFSYGMDLRLPLVCDVLEDIFHPTGIIARNESPLRLLEALQQEQSVLRGVAAPVAIREHDIEYIVNPLLGQKTGFFLDQRENRFAVRRLCQGARVLDCFCNDGGFALNAARGGATSVLGIDVSADAIERATINAHRNSLESVRFMRADVFEKLMELGDAQVTFDVLILDPPSFTKSRKNVPMAKKGYRDLHSLAIPLIAKGGILVSASCSHHIESEVFLGLISQSAARADRRLQLLEWRGAAPDHPVLPAMPETEYLKFGIFRVH